MSLDCLTGMRLNNKTVSASTVTLLDGPHRIRYWTFAIPHHTLNLSP